MTWPEALGAKNSPSLKFIHKEQRQELKEAFELFDTQKTNYIDYSELKVILKALGFSNMKKQDVARLAREYDPDEKGKIEYTDYLDLSELKSDSEICWARSTRWN